MTIQEVPALFQQRNRTEREAEHRRVVQDAAAHATAGSAARMAEADRVRGELMGYLRMIGVGARFQSINFTNWLDRRGAMPAADLFDPRGIGGLIVTLSRCGVIERRGFEPDGGCAARNCNSTTRPVYVVASLDFKRAGWGGVACPG